VAQKGLIDETRDDTKAWVKIPEKGLNGRVAQALFLSLARQIKAKHMELPAKIHMDEDTITVEFDRVMSWIDKEE